MSSQQREDIWRGMLEAEANDCFWNDEAKRYGAHARYLSIGTSIFSSGAVIALLTVPAWHSMSGKILAAITSIVSIIHTSLYSPTRLKQLGTIAGTWKKMAIDYRLLWSEVESKYAPDAKQWRTFETLCKQEKEIDESGFTVDTERFRAAQNQVKRRRGFIK
jgi:hypothetical protein